MNSVIWVAISGGIGIAVVSMIDFYDSCTRKRDKLVSSWDTETFYTKHQSCQHNYSKINSWLSSL